MKDLENIDKCVDDIQVFTLLDAEQRMPALLDTGTARDLIQKTWAYESGFPIVSDNGDEPS